MTRTKLILGAVLLALGVLVVVQVGRPPGAENTTLNAAKPRRVVTTPDADGRKQVIIQVWWEPSDSAARLIYEIDQLSPPERTESGHGPGTPWERRGWARPGARIYFGWAFDGPLRTLRYRIWVQGQQLGETGATTRPIGSVNTVVP